jgi:DNA-3-methyladenine glycosylase II
LPALIRAIVSQQLSTKAARTIGARLWTLLDGRPTTARVAAASDDALRGVGLSGQKAGYLRDLCAKVENGALPLRTLKTMSDEDVVASLTRVKGIGRWTAEMVLMFRLQRPDALPVGDLGIVKAARRIYGRRKAPTPERLTTIGDAWRPDRSVACWYLWASLGGPPGQE